MTKLRIVLADDHVVVREGLKALINAQADMDVVGEANNGIDVVRQVEERQPDVVIMDITMPGGSGVAAAEQLRERYPGVKVLALSVHEDMGYVRKLIDAGAAGYVLKSAAADTLIGAIRTVAAGEEYLDPSLTNRVVRAFLRNRPDETTLRQSTLTDREAEVIRLIAQGHSNKEIAAQLAISVKTVETYKARAMEKLGVASRTALVRYALRQGWLQDD